MTKGQAIFFLIAGIWMGTVFIFGQQYWHAFIEPEEAIYTEATFDSYRETFSKGRINGITVFFDDYDQLFIERACINAELRNALKDIAPGAKVVLMIHPNSEAILDMRVNGKMLLEFYDAREKITAEKNDFVLFGIFFYGLALYAVISLVQRIRQKKKNKQRKKRKKSL